MKLAKREDIIKMLDVLSKKFPNLRIAQIIANAVCVEPCPTLYYLSDEALLKDLNKLNE